jgi:hypothetical protein
MIEFDRNRPVEAIGGELRGATFKLGDAATRPAGDAGRASRMSARRRAGNRKSWVIRPAGRFRLIEDGPCVSRSAAGRSGQPRPAG